MIDTILMLVLFLGLFCFGLLCTIWPEKMKRFDFSIFRLISYFSPKIFNVYMRVCGVFFILLSLVIFYGIAKSFIRHYLGYITINIL